VNPSAILGRLVARQDLARAEMAALVGRIVDGELEPEAVAALLAALATKGETADEIAGAAEALRARVRPVPHRQRDLVDTCGTGGDGRGTHNVSTAAALLAAAGAARVAKHGNRAVSSRSGSADVLAALGLCTELDPEESGRRLDGVGLAFLFAPLHHPAMRAVAPIRRALGVRTVFNLVGPLTNPAGARRQLLGVFAPDRVEPMARVLSSFGAERALVVHGEDGLDEITTTASTIVAEVEGDRLRTYRLSPEEIGVRRGVPAELLGGTPEQNARAIETTLGGAPGPLAEIVAANAGAALYVAGRVDSIRRGVELARELLASRAGLEMLGEIRRLDAALPPPPEAERLGPSGKAPGS
jgi:anthranilate phosphoribosyltransferase